MPEVLQRKSTSRFSSLQLEFTGEFKRGRAVFRLINDFTYYEGSLKVTVPANYKTDGASIPWGFWNIFPPFGKYAREAVLHDWLCDNRTICSRFLADAIFRELMTRRGVRWTKKLLMYYAVRFWGLISRQG